MTSGLFLLAGAATLFGLGALVAAVRALRKLRRLEERLAAFMNGKDGSSLEEGLTEQCATVAQHTAEIANLVSASEYLHRAIQASLRKVSFERYNPFPGVGGNQSFTLVLLDAFNSGVVITSLHNREATRVYAKAIQNGKPLHNLSEEEDRVVKNALLQKGA